MKITVTRAERTTIVAALVAYGCHELAITIVGESREPEDDGPEVKILRNEWKDQYANYTEGNGARDSES
jgi:hypothetical protein